MFKGLLGFVGGESVESIIWDDSGITSDGQWPGAGMPEIYGDPTGVKVIPFHAKINTTIGRWPMLLHGWWSVRVVAETWPTNSSNPDVRSRDFTFDTLSEHLWMPFWSNLDPTASIPEDNNWLLGDGSSASFYGDPSSGFGSTSGGSFKSNFAPYPNNFPPILAPITEPWTVNYHSYAYATDPRLPNSLSQVVKDPDLHHGVFGTILHELNTHNGEANGEFFTFNPAVLGQGKHKIAFRWDTKIPDDDLVFHPGEEATSIFVIEVTVGDNNVIDTNPPMWINNTLQPQRLEGTGQQRLCDPSDGKCITIGTLSIP